MTDYANMTDAELDALSVEALTKTSVELERRKDMLLDVGLVVWKTRVAGDHVLCNLILLDPLDPTEQEVEAKRRELVNLDFVTGVEGDLVNSATIQCKPLTASNC